MPQTFLPVGKMNLEFGPSPGDHCWYIVNGVPIGDGGYTSFGNLTVQHFGTAVTCAATNVIRGVHQYYGAYTSPRTFIADDSRILDDGNDRSGAAYGNTTAPWGMQFCTYGPYVLATNRVDPIQYIDVTVAAAVPATNFAAITPGTNCANPKAATICTYKNHIILGNIVVDETPNDYGALLDGTYPSLVWWSGTDLPFYFGSPAEGDSPAILGTDYRQTFDGDGEIVKLVATDSCVFIFKTGSILRMDGPPFQISLVSNQYGTHHPESVKALGRRVYFVSQAGPCYLSIDDNQIVFISDRTVQRALCLGDGHFGLTMPPGPRNGLGSKWGCTSDFGPTDDLQERLSVSAAADPVSQQVVFHFAQSPTSIGYGSTMDPDTYQDVLRQSATLLYDQRSEEFTLITPHATGSTYRKDIQMVTTIKWAGSYGSRPLTSVFFLGTYDNDGDNVIDTIRQWCPVSSSLQWKTSSNSDYGHTMTFCWPFKMFSEVDSNSQSNIVAVKPVWFSEFNTNRNPEFNVRVYTMLREKMGAWFGYGTSDYETVVSDGYGTSENGWITVDTPAGFAHAITFDIGAYADPDHIWTTIRGFYGLLVKYSGGQGRNA